MATACKLLLNVSPPVPKLRHVHYYSLQLAFHNYTTTTTTAHSFNKVLAPHFLNPKGATPYEQKGDRFLNPQGEILVASWWVPAKSRAKWGRLGKLGSSGEVGEAREAR